MKYPDARLLLFAPAPWLGGSSPSLVSVLGEAGAQDLQRQLLEHQIAVVKDAALCPLQLWTDAAASVDLPAFPGERRAQQGSDPGERLRQAIQSAVPGSQRVLIIGTACPGLDAAYLEQALALLDEGRALALGPARGGGCALLGLRPALADGLFDELEWGGEQLLSQLQQAASAAGLRVRLLPELASIERPQDLALLADHGIFPRISRRLLADQGGG